MEKSVVVGSSNIAVESAHTLQLNLKREVFITYISHKAINSLRVCAANNPSVVGVDLSIGGMGQCSFLPTTDIDDHHIAWFLIGKQRPLWIGIQNFLTGNDTVG